MATPAPAQPLCQRIQLGLEKIKGCTTPSSKRDRLGYLEAILSPANAGQIQLKPVNSGGKRRQVELIYIQRGLESAVVQSQPTGYCDADDERTPLSQVVDVEHWVHRKLKFTEEELRKICYESDETFLANVVLAEMNALLTVVNKHLLSIQATNFGVFADGDTSKEWIALDPVSSAPNYLEESKALEEYALVSGCGTPFVIGAGNMSHYVRMINKSCCNGASGLDGSQFGDFMFFHDKYVNSELGGGGEHYIMLAPGAVQLATWNANVEHYAYINGKDEAATIMDPFTQLVFDLDKVWDPCTKTYTVTIALNYQPIFVPANGFADDDPLNGVNYTLHFTS